MGGRRLADAFTGVACGGDHRHALLVDVAAQGDAPDDTAADAGALASGPKLLAKQDSNEGASCWCSRCVGCANSCGADGRPAEDRGGFIGGIGNC